ncbi:NAD(P)-binding protein [Trichoderma novae-zelandiae]
MSVGIFPASGGLGTSTYTHLLNSKTIPASDVVLISRFPDKTPQVYRDQGVHLRQATFESSPEDLEAAFKGLKTLFLISYPSHNRGYRTPLQLAALDAAHRAGVKHVFYSSLAFALPDKDTTKAEVMGTHLDTEAHLRKIAAQDPGFTWTSVREGLYSESTGIYTAFLDLKDPSSTEIRIPHDGSGPGISWAKRDELGEATAALIAQHFKDPANFPWTNKIVILTGPREWSLAETAKLLSAVAGRDLTIRQVSVDEYVAQPQVLEHFGSEELARTWATSWEAIRDGETAHVSPTLGELLGRRPEDLDVTVKNLYGSPSAN